MDNSDIILNVGLTIGSFVVGIIVDRITRKKSGDYEASTARVYIARTILISLKVMLSGGDKRTPPTSENMKYWLSCLQRYNKDYPTNKADDIYEKINELNLNLNTSYPSNFEFPDVLIRGVPENKVIVDVIEGLLLTDKFKHAAIRPYS